MNELLQAAEDAQRLLRGFTGVQVVADALARAGTVEQQRVEAQTALDALQPQIVAARADLAQLQADAELVTSKAQEIATRITADAYALVAEASAKAQALVLDAQVEALHAKAQAESFVASCAAEVDKRMAMVQAASDELTALNDKIAAAKAAAVAILGS